MPINATGFERKRLADIKTDYDTRFTDALGAVNTSPDAVVGQLIGLFSAAVDEVEEQLQDNYDAMYPSSAEGTSLDGSVLFVGMDRLGSTATKVTACAYGVDGTLIPLGSQARSGLNSFATTADTVISRANALDVEITVTTVLNSTSYQIIAGGVLAEFTSDASATGTEIAAGLAADFNPAIFTATATGSKIRLHSFDKVSDFPLTIDANLTITKLGSPAIFTAINKGAIVVPVNSLVTIDSPTVGWDSISNLVAGDTGRDVETDEQLRIRQKTGVRAAGSATAKAIRARLESEVPEITAAYVYENRTNGVVDSMPPHSIEAVVAGASDQDVFNKLFEVKPAGIETYGSVTGQVIDENGDGQTVKFSRPVTHYAWIRVSIDAMYSEESAPATIDAAIKAAVLAFGESLTVGNDIIPQRFFGSIYAATTGLGQITVEAAITATEGGTPSYSTNNIAIGRAGIAAFANSRISVIGI